MSDMEAGELERCGRAVGVAADDVESAARGLTDSGCDLGLRLQRAIAVVRAFAEELDQAARGWSETG